MGTKLTITSILWLSVGLLLGCGSLVKNQTLYVEMYGSDETPDRASGDTTPRSQKYTLTSVTLIAADGSSETQLFDGTSAKTAKIVNRLQIIYSKDVTELVGESYSGAIFTFDRDVSGSSENSNNHSFTLSTPTLSITKDFKVEEAQDIRFVIEAKWKNTVSGDDMVEPDFIVNLD